MGKKIEIFEKVNPAHPDKVADRIAGALVDLAYKKQNDPKIAVEVLLGHGRCTIIAESSVEITALEAASIVERISGIRETNFTLVPQDEHLAANQAEEIRCGDNGIFKGVCPNSMELYCTDMAEMIYKDYPSDGKYIMNNVGRSNNNICITICQSNLKDEDIEMAKEKYCFVASDKNDVIINPLGEWTGGPDADCGATNRKLGSDMGRGATGGGLHGKDLSKADVSVNIYCYLKARNSHTGIAEAVCSIGDTKVIVLCDGIKKSIPYFMIVQTAREYIEDCGGFEKFAEWGLVKRARD